MKPDALGDPGERALVRRKTIPVHEHDGAGADAARERGAQRGFGRSLVECAHHLAMCAHALVDLDHFLVEHRRQFDAPHEEFRPVLVGDAQGIGETARGHEHGAVALALEQRIGCDRRAHLDGLDGVLWQRIPGAEA